MRSASKALLFFLSFGVAAYAAIGYFPTSVAASVAFAAAYPIIAWLCWLPNLAFAEWRYNAAVPAQQTLRRES